MSVMLLGSSFVTAVLIPPDAFQPGHPADGRALAYLAHELLRHRLRHDLRRQHDRDPLVRRRVGDGRAAEPRPALPAALRHGAGVGAREPAARRHHHRHHARSSRSSSTPSVDAQGGAYATGVLVLMSSAALAVAITAWRQSHRWVAVPRHHGRLRLHDDHQHLRAARRHQDRLALHRHHRRHVARVARAALDRAARARHRARRAGGAVHRRRPSTRRGASGSSPTVRATARSRSTQAKLRGGDATRTTCPPAIRCCFSRSARATRRSSARS